MSLKPGGELIPKDDHRKVLFDTVDLCSTWEAMEKCKDAGLTKSIGVSNFNRRQLEMILNEPGLKYKPVCNQGGPELPSSLGRFSHLCLGKKAQVKPSSDCPSLPAAVWSCGPGQRFQ